MDDLPERTSWLEPDDEECDDGFDDDATLAEKKWEEQEDR